MLKVKRQEYLLKRIREDESLSVNELAKELNISMMTIRRDLDEMQKNNALKRVHGGAVIENDEVQPSFFRRSVEQREKKAAIAAEAVKRIRPGDIVIFDGGTTTLEIAKAAPAGLRFTAVTTGLQTAIVLCGKPNVEVINIGGAVHGSSFTTFGHLAVEMLAKISADLAFITTKAVDAAGTYEALPLLIEIKRAVVNSAKRVILVADSAKINAASLSKAVDWKDIDEFITNSDRENSLVELKKIVKVTTV